jgi:hypothetical protein
MPGLRPRRAVRMLALARPSVLPSTITTVSAPGTLLSRLNGWPMHSPADASPPPLRMTGHGSGPMRIATPSSWRTCTAYFLPVSRRTVISADCDTHGVLKRMGGTTCGLKPLVGGIGEKICAMQVT